MGGALRDAWRGLKSGMDEMKSGMDGELQIARFAELQESAYATPRYAIWQDEETMARHVAVVEREHGGFWGPYTSLAVDERAPVVELPFQPWDRLHRPELVEAQRVMLKHNV